MSSRLTSTRSTTADPSSIAGDDHSSGTGIALIRNLVERTGQKLPKLIAGDPPNNDDEDRGHQGDHHPAGNVAALPTAGRRWQPRNESQSCTANSLGQ